MKFYCVSGFFHKEYKTEDLTEAYEIFNKVVDEGHTYVELAEVEDNGSWYSKSIEIYMK